VLPGGSLKTRESLVEYLVRPPISLGKVSLESFHGKVLFHISYRQYFKENLKHFTAAYFIVLLTQHLPPKGVHYHKQYPWQFPRRWLQELFANLCSHVCLADVESGLLESLVTFPLWFSHVPASEFEYHTWD
jgi:hypothetical protein